MEVSLPLQYEQLLYLINQLSDSQLSKLRADIDKKLFVRANAAVRDTENVVNVDTELQQLLDERKKYSQQFPESKVEWSKVRNEITKKYGF